MSVNQSETRNLRSAIAGGLAAGTAYLGAMWLDSKLSSWPFNDLKLVGQMFTTRSPLWQLQGLAGHYGFSVIMALLYVRYGRQRLRGPGWLRGIIFLLMENVLLYPLGLVADRMHAGIKYGQLPPVLNRKTFFGQLIRHVAFGAVLGEVIRETRNAKRDA